MEQLCDEGSGKGLGGGLEWLFLGRDQSSKY